MAPTTFNRTGITPTDDSGLVPGGSDGTVFDAAWWAHVYDHIDAFLAAALTLGSTLSVEGGQITFPATQSASAGANTLDDYEENTWTPTDASGAGLSFSNVQASYVKIGQLVLATADLTYPTTADGSAMRVGGLPFTTNAAQTNGYHGHVGYTDSSQAIVGVSIVGTSAYFYKSDGSQPTNANMSTKVLRFSVMYRASA